MDAPDDYLLMSGIQHFAFCRRQWALIHLEQQWAENLRTTEGQLDHARCHDDTQTECRKDLLITRGMRVVSHRLRMSGNCDVVEFRASEAGISLQSAPGFWQPYPVEYKHGHAKETDADRLQLCAQAMALEEMLVCRIPEGALYYCETRRREVVPFTPKVKPGKHCSACSLKELCLPVLCRNADAKAYLRSHLDEAATEVTSCGNS